MSGAPATLALDLGGTKLAAALVVDGRIVERDVTPTRPDAGPDGWVEDMAAAARRWSGRFEGIGVAVSGAVRDGSWSAPNRRILDLDGDYPLVKTLAGLARCAVHAANDAQAAAWGEYVRGAGRATRDMVYLTVSTGIGGGIVVDGRLHRGARALAGHVGQIPDGDAGAPLEDAAGGRAVGRAFAGGGTGPATDAPAGSTRPEQSAEPVFDAAAAGDARAGALIEGSARRVARLCRTLQAVLDPELVVIGGGVGLAPGYLERVRGALGPHGGPLHPTLVRAALGADAGLVGIADLARGDAPHTPGRTI